MFDSRTKPQIFMLPKVEARPKGPPLGFFSGHYATFFSKIIEFHQRVPPCIFLGFATDWA